MIEIRPAEGLAFYDYDAKYAPEQINSHTPAPAKPNVYQLAQKLSLAAHRALGCRGIRCRAFARRPAEGAGEMMPLRSTPSLA